MHRGELSADSPALLGALRRAVGSEQLQLLSRIYNAASANGALREPLLAREPGVSFNPRPARIAQILVLDGVLLDPIAIAAAMLSCADALPAPESLRDADERKAYRLAAEVHAMLASDPPDPCEEPHATILLAHLLDNVRHLHMYSVTNEVRSELLQGYERQLSAWASPAFDHCLVGKIRTAISRWRPERG